MSRLEELKKMIDAENAQKQQKMLKEFQKEYPWLFSTYKTEKFSKPMYDSFSGSTFKEKIFADYFKVFKQLCIAVGSQKFTNFLEFTKNSNTCSRIKSMLNENGEVIAGHSYIIISNNNEILTNMATWIIFELTDMNSNLFVRSNSFKFTEFATELEKQQKKIYQSEDEEIPQWEQISGDIYYDIVKLSNGYIFPTETDAQKANAFINNRMITLMECSMPKGMIILIPEPIPFFTKQAEKIKELHILDLRNITSNIEETVEME